MIKIFCDRCGQKCPYTQRIAGSDIKVKIEHLQTEDEKYHTRHCEVTNKDLCIDCLEKLYDWLKGDNDGEEEKI